MKQSIRKKLKKNGVTVALLIFLIAFAGQICIFILKNTSHKIVVEYNELEAIVEYKLSLFETLTSLNTYISEGNPNEQAKYQYLIQKNSRNLQHCKNVITKTHNVEILDSFETDLITIRQLGSEMYSYYFSENNTELHRIQNEISAIINRGIIGIETIQKETQTEIIEYVDINSKANRHSMITIISLGVIIIIIVMIGGMNLIKSITAPIKKLTEATKLIGEGYLNTEIKIEAHQEFRSLADNFNSMVKTLRKTTVSRNHYDNILKNMIDPVIIADANGKIEVINNAAEQLLGYKHDELNGSNFEDLFINSKSKVKDHLGVDSLNKNEYLIQEEDLISKEGVQISVKIAGTQIQGADKENEGYVIVAHDLTLQKSNEKIIEEARRERLIAINDAEENERLRIATDLHDGLGQILTAISYSVQNTFTEELLKDKEVKANFTNIQGQLDKAIRGTKSIAQNLMPMVLNDFGLVVAIKKLISEVSQKSNTRFHFKEFNLEERIDPKLEKTIYRICQEAINNILKHAKANNVEIQIVRHPDLIVLGIDDDGQGFDYKKYSQNIDSKGIGLMSIRERVKAFNGEFSLTSDHKGTEIFIEFPCRKKSK